MQYVRAHHWHLQRPLNVPQSHPPLLKHANTMRPAQLILGFLARAPILSLSLWFRHLTSATI